MMIKVIMILMFGWIDSITIVGQSDSTALKLLYNVEIISKPISAQELTKLDRPSREAYALYSQLFGPDLFLPVFCIGDFKGFPKLKYIVTQKSLNVGVTGKITDDLLVVKDVCDLTISPFLPYLQGNYTPLYYFEKQKLLLDEFTYRHGELTIFPECGIPPLGNELLFIPFWSTEHYVCTMESDGAMGLVQEADFSKYPKEKLGTPFLLFEKKPAAPIVTIVFNKAFSKAVVEIKMVFGSEYTSFTNLLVKRGAKWIFIKHGTAIST